MRQIYEWISVIFYRYSGLLQHALVYLMFFQKNKTKKMAKETQIVNPQVINLIAQGTRITGEVASDGDIRIDGELIGNVETKSRLVIGISGKIEGEIKCKSCEIAGTHKGKIFVNELLSLKASCNVNGDINTEKLSIEPGAYFAGTCSMGNDSINDESKKQ